MVLLRLLVRLLGEDVGAAVSSFTVATLREDEMTYRARGKFDLAVQRQRAADLLESGVDPDICSFFDRGVIPSVEWGEINGMTGFILPSGLTWLLTQDQLEILWAVVTTRLGITPEFLSSMALAMAEDRALREARMAP
jgi:hypothetical protein